ncbi:hypothetical protein BBO99_00009660 [Phytophthora kernoviae]|uniref:Peptidase M13 N-terminal domain-containing protein n=2 Tax=Phytophthora kernoviae TaxID=325452 RepID=A0A3R7HQV3_9STRA|nr:hypothetical protein G195_011502 [Phytophthora kernoviae 00238/432]KAG2502738.1 hypothetical protein JM16_009638 [Phytophthora kernoviae]KAG2503040.1 hypothetical protein JM18_009670 [Phytophthora kernoviae]RLM97613.1 hypothetical protein BBI17_009703 [Phytophthora kernoviae]RLN72858.1 hypothetical protein BBO99_00009660 [Phytophthora kernoviae]
MNLALTQSGAVIQAIIQEDQLLIAEFWASCMGVKTLSALGNKPPQADLKKIQAINSKKELLFVAGELGQQSVNHLSGMDVYADEVNDSVNIVLAGMPPLTLDLSNYDRGMIGRIEPASRNEIDLEDLKLYLAYVYVDSVELYLSEPFYQARSGLSSNSIGAVPIVPARSDVCTAPVKTNLPELISKYYAHKMFDIKREEDVDFFVHLIENALGEHMKKLDWLDDLTRKAAEAKLAKACNLAGCSKMMKSYSYTLQPATYFKNVKTIVLGKWTETA